MVRDPDTLESRSHFEIYFVLNGRWEGRKIRGFFYTNVHGILEKGLLYERQKDSEFLNLVTKSFSTESRRSFNGPS